MALTVLRLVKSLLEHYMDWKILSFHQYFVRRQYQFNRIAFGSKFSIRPIWIDLYSLFINFFQKAIWIEPNYVVIKIFLKDIIDQRVYSFGQNFLNRQYGLTRFVFWSKFSNRTAWIEKCCL